MGLFDLPTADATKTPASGSLFDIHTPPSTAPAVSKPSANLFNTPIPTIGANAKSNFTTWGTSPAVTKAVATLPDKLPTSNKDSNFENNFSSSPSVTAALGKLPGIQNFTSIFGRTLNPIPKTTTGPDNNFTNNFSSPATKASQSISPTTASPLKPDLLSSLLNSPTFKTIATALTVNPAVADAIPALHSNQPTVRRQDFVDVLNTLPQLAGIIATPFVSTYKSLQEVVTGKPQGTVTIPSFGYGISPAKMSSLKTTIENDDNTLTANLAHLVQQEAQLNKLKSSGDAVGFNKLVDEYNSNLDTYNNLLTQHKTNIATYDENIAKEEKRGTLLQAQGAKQYFQDQLDSGVPEKQAFWNTALKTTGDVAAVVTMSRDFSKLALLKTNPEALISDVQYERQDIFDYLTGKKTAAQVKMPVELDVAIKHVIENGTQDEKVALVKKMTDGLGKLTVKPSRLGVILGVSPEEAESIFYKTHGPISETSTSVPVSSNEIKGGVNEPVEPTPESSQTTPSKESIQSLADEIKQRGEMERANIPNNGESMAFREKGVVEIPEELKPLAKEAKKYDNANQFVDAHTQNSLLDLSNPQQHRFGRIFSDTGEGIQDLVDINKEYSSKIPRELERGRVPNITDPNKEVTIYRAAHTTAKSILPGDYVSFSKEYAASHMGENGLNRTQLLEMKVPAKDVIWQGNDMTEWIYSPENVRNGFKDLTDFYNQVHGLDSSGKPIENGGYGTTGGETRLERQSNSKRGGSISKLRDGSVENSNDQQVSKGAFSIYERNRGNGPEGGERKQAIRLRSEESVKVDSEISETLHEFGFSKEFTDRLVEENKKGGVQNIKLENSIANNERATAAFNLHTNTLHINQNDIDHPSIKDGTIINHEVDGHSWYSKISPEGRKEFYDNLKSNKELLKQAWEISGENTHASYWQQTIEQIKDLIAAISDTDVADEIAYMTSLRSNPIMELDTFIDRSLNLDKTITAINTELSRRGLGPISLQAQDTLAIMEHNAMIAENASKLPATDDSIVGRYVQDIQDGTLQFGENGVNSLTYEGESDLSTKLLEKLKGRDFVSKQFISDLTNSGDLKQVERDLFRDILAQYPDGAQIPVKQFAEDVKIELLPLEVKTSYGKISGGETGEGDKFSAKYEYVNLPTELRGEVSDYREHIYNSPVKTSAGGIHFKNKTENYFGHTRIEDMSDDDTRRVIEVQSDLYQKGNLEKETKEIRNIPGGYPNQIQVSVGKKRMREVAKLQQYNDPTAHFRMAREEVKQAAKDGKTKLQFPTGKTALAIEGLGQRNNWTIARGANQTNFQTLKPEDLEIGKKISDGNESWTITEVLGEGKFKAIPTNQESFVIRNQADGDIETTFATEKEAQEFLKQTSNPDLVLDTLGQNFEETFDISGKVDTANPIYRFYEKDLGRYLKNQYGATPITDDKGVTWNEVAIKPDMADKPVMAFREKGSDELENLRDDLKRVQGYLDVAVSNQDQPILKNKIPALKAEVNTIREKIMAAKFPKVDTAKEALENIEKRTGVKPVNIPQVQNQLSRVQLSLRAAEEAPEAHQKAYGKDKIPEYKEKISNLKEKLQEAIKSPQLPPAPTIRVSNNDIQIPDDLYHRQISLELRREEIKNNQAQHLSKYEAQSGEFKDELPEVTGKISESVSRIQNKDVKKWIMQGDDIATQFGYDSTEDARKAYNEYKLEKQSIRETSAQLKKDLSEYIKTEKDRLAIEKLATIQNTQAEKEQTKEEKATQRAEEAESVKNYRNFVETYAEEANVPKSVEEVEPPSYRGVKSPRLDLMKANDKGWMARYSIDRNIENAFTREDAEKLNKFLTQRFMANATKEVEFVDEYLKPLQDEMKRLGIKPGSDESAFVQIYGEGLINIDQLMKEFPKTWEKIQEAVPAYKKMYAAVLNRVNPERHKFGHDAILPLKNYFPHFDAISFWTKHYGILNKNDDLPTSIAGETQNFQPSKIFNRHELHRTGRKTSYDAIKGAKEYIQSMARQFVSMDNLAHARAVDKYIKKSAEVGEKLGTPLHLSRFQTNFKEVIQNQLGNKMGGLDREGEKFGDRKIVNAALTVSTLVGKNIVAFNPATMLTHTVSMALNAATVDKVDFIKGLLTTVASPFNGYKNDIPYYMIDGQKSDLLYRRYPTKYLKTKFETVEEAGGWLLKQADIFKTRTAVASKYYELRKQGVSPEVAIKEADLYAGRIVGDYSRGVKPILTNQKFLKIIDQFQFGMNDGLSVLLHDIPYQTKKIDGKVIKLYKGKDGIYREKQDYIKLWWKLAQYAVFIYFLDQELKKIKGSGAGLNPIDIALTVAGQNDTGRGKPLGTRIGLSAEEAAAGLPYANILFGNSPTATAFAQPWKDLLAGNLLKSGAETAEMIASPVGGGLQAKKTITGLQAYNKGYVTNSSGVPQFPIQKGVIPAIQSAVFGPSGNETAQSFYNTKGGSKPMQATYNEVQQLVSEGKQDQAQTLVDALSDTDYKSYKAISTAAKTQKTKQSEIAAIPVAQNIQNLIKAGKTDQAQKIVDGMTDDEYKYYQGAKKLLTTANKKTAGTFGAGDSEWEKQSLVEHIANIAKAVIMHPIQYFNNIFDGAGDWRVTGAKNGALLVARMSLDASESIKRAAGEDNSDWKLDHIQPLEAGGNNSTDNLQMIPTSQWAANTPVESLIAVKLQSGAINGAKAKEFAIRYKAGQGEVLSPAYMDLYKNKYKSQPITAEEIQSY